MFQQYSHSCPENTFDTRYPESSISGASVPFVDSPIPQAPATAHLHRSLKSSRDTSPFPIPRQPSPYASSVPSLSRSESQPNSLGDGHVAPRGPNSGFSSHSEKGGRHHHCHSHDILNPPNARDSEKRLVRYVRSQSRDSQFRCTIYTYSSDEMYRENSCAENNAVWILVSASLSCSPSIPPYPLTNLDAIDLPLPPLAPPYPSDRHLHRPCHAAPVAPRASLPLHILRFSVGEIAFLPLAAVKFPAWPDFFPKQCLGPRHEQYAHAHPPQPVRSHLRHRHCAECLGRRCLLVLCGNFRRSRGRRRTR